MKTFEPFNKIGFAVDRGGTFTDIFAVQQGVTYTEKLLSEDPANYDDAPREGIRRLLERITGQKISPGQVPTSAIKWIRMGTTVATNALLERQGAPCCLVITRGFADLLRIGYQNRPDLFALNIIKPQELYVQVLEIDERVCPERGGKNSFGLDLDTATGTSGESFKIIKKPDENLVREQLRAIYDQGIRSLAVVLMHGYSFHDHEALIGSLAKDIGFTHISLSHQIMPRIRITGRGDTTCLDAYLTPHIADYLNNFRRGFNNNLENIPLHFMRSDGGLVKAKHFQASNAILSGPAGGVVGCAMTTFARSGGKPVIGFDMGGTSTDVSRYNGEYELIHECELAGVRIQAPQMDIRTVAAGGGSRLFYRNFMLQVGPQSSGAHPGPVCYRKNGYLSVTDANLFLGRLQADHFPAIFGPAENQPLDYEQTRRAFIELTEEINLDMNARGQAAFTPEQVALGFLDVANEVMVRPIREVSVMRGFNIREHVLACFGGAGGQHGCAIARKLGICEIFIHRHAGILSAVGMALADVVRDYREPAGGRPLQTARPELTARLASLEAECRAELEQENYEQSRIAITRYLNLRYRGTDTTYMIEEPLDGDFQREFSARHLREYGFDLENTELLVDDIRIRATVSAGVTLSPAPIKSESEPGAPAAMKTCYFEQGWLQTPVYLLEDLGQGQQITGPALIIQNGSTIVVEPGCVAEIHRDGITIALAIAAEREDVQKSGDDSVDPVRLAVFANRFMSIAEQMGRVLQKTAISTNIKERLDFSCAIFDEQGGLTANAPHVPVHLGAMSEAVRQQIKLWRGDLQPGDVLVGNHPSAGGSHLPDITVITPVWRKGGICFFVACRGHHCDIGSISPGSMPPFSRTLDEEGLHLKSFKLVTRGEFKERELRALMAAITPPVRQPDAVIADLKAQVAANRRGIELLLEMMEELGEKPVLAYMRHIQENAESAVRDMLRGLAARLSPAGAKAVVFAEDFLDDGSPIRLKLEIEPRDGTALFDFTGSGHEMWGNLNAPRAVTQSAILYALRCLVEQDIPLNQGCLNPITIQLAKGSLLDPSEQAAVVGGNVLTSQRIVDVIFKAMRAVAASQGCMNNLTFGNNEFGYYETIGGGSGAGPDFHGCPGVHTHMTNTRITDPEIMEQRYPLLIREFAIRAGSGGKGRYHGGDGLAREIEFLDELRVAILSERRVFQPYGMDGGEPGRTGENLFLPKDGRIINLGGKNEITVKPGDRIRILTPGGGGWGGPAR